MEVRCHTPFIPQYFKSRDKNGVAYDQLVVKATYDIVDDRRIKISQDQAPVTMADEYWGAVNVTSVARESDLASYKPHTDFVVIGDAHAPNGRPAQHWYAEVRLGDTRKAIRVTGPRRWRRNMARIWTLTDPDPALTVPVRYERAFGGTFPIDEQTLDAFRQNPVGVGWAPKRPSEAEIPAPQIEDPVDLVEDFGREYRPQGFGFIGRAWSPRLEYAGTYDDEWKASQWPLSPHDWDDRYNNGAHPDLQIPGFLRGGEPFSATNMTPSGHCSFEVPRWQVDVRLRYRTGVIDRHRTNLDTFLVDFTQGKVFLTYRVRVPETDPLRVVEICMRDGE